jgi:nucleoside-diphosphate-sugar epimerase
MYGQEMAGQDDGADQTLHKTCSKMKILMTGASGFLGGIMKRTLETHDIITVGRHPSDNIPCDLSLAIPRLVESDIVVHAAGKAHVIPKDRSEEQAFFDVNLEGTKNLLKGISKLESAPTGFVFISTVAVYGVETGALISEDHPMMGNTPYALSKIKAEQEVLSWGASSGVPVAILRLPLVVGPDAPGNLGAMVRHLRRGTYLRIGDGAARRSMVLAEDVARLIPSLKGKTGIYNLTDRMNPSIAELDSAIAASMQKNILVIPSFVASLLAKLGDLIPRSPFNTYRFDKLRQSLTFTDDKAVRELDWAPKSVLSGDFL